ncbi:hypothetical protein Y032_0698g1619 [Ancylostoma ceylanicum]|uniref:Uncharacterized protein n=1 Tax=Ancylostoma ceylanicum TaxID=53326 RepID=A0A016WHH7_9BILA|nr:hypothetical protein Y032_0698g1619 [Ancylostoma ceylanicum]
MSSGVGHAPPELVARDVYCDANFCSSQFKAMTSKYGETRHRRVEVHVLVCKNHPHMAFSIRPYWGERMWTTLSHSPPLPNLVLSN